MSCARSAHPSHNCILRKLTGLLHMWSSGCSTKFILNKGMILALIRFCFSSLCQMVHN
jgi:hypothetical protein